LPTPPTTTSGSTSTWTGRSGESLQGPIAHGYLTLSLLIPMLAEVLTVSDAALGVNYGLNSPLPTPVPVGSKIRLTATLPT